MDDINDLNVAWSEIDGEGLVRVIPADSFKTGFIVLATIGKEAEKLGYYPEILLTSEKITVTIPENDNGRDHELARTIDDVLDDATNGPAEA